MTTTKPDEVILFQGHCDNLIVDLRAAIATGGPTAEQVDVVKQLLDAIPAAWHHLLPLPSSETYESDDDGSLCPAVCFCSGRARLRMDVLNRENIFIERGADGGSNENGLNLADKAWRQDLLDYLRWFISESLEE